MYLKLIDFIPQNLQFELLFISAIFSVICCILYTGAKVAKVKSDPTKTWQDVNLVWTKCLMKCGPFYMTGFAAFLILIARLGTSLNILF